MKTTLRIVACFWYVFIAPGGLDLKQALEPLMVQPGISEACSQHFCSCSVRGYCADTCCCAPSEESEPDHHEVVLNSCGDDTFHASSNEKARCLKPVSETSRRLQTWQINRADNYLKSSVWAYSDPPMKVPISA